MSSTEELHELIKTMSRAEIRSFRQMAGSNSKDGQNNYLKLFDVIRKHGEQGEEFVRKKLRKEAFVDHLATTRYQLSKLLLHSLCSHHSGKDPLAELQEGIKSAKLLFERGLWDFGERLLKKLRRTAEAYDFYYEQYEIFRLELPALMRLQTKDMESTLLGSLDREKEVFQKMSIEREYEDIKYRVSILLGNQTTVRDKNTLEKIEQVMRQPLLVDKEQAMTFFSKWIFLSVHAQYATFTGEYYNASEHWYRAKELWDAEPHRIALAPKVYKACLNNLLNSCMLAGRYDEAMALVRTIRAQPSLSIADEIATFLRTTIIELSYEIQAGSFNNGTACIDEAELRLEKYSGKIDMSQGMLIAYYGMTYLFLNGNFARAAEWLDRMLDNRKFDLVQEYKEIARVLLPIVHFELRNVTLVSSLSRSAQRFLERSGLFNDFYRSLFAGLNKLAATVQTTEIPGICRKLHQELSGMDQSHSPSNSVLVNFVTLWLESKADEISITEAHLRESEGGDSSQ